VSAPARRDGSLVSGPAHGPRMINGPEGLFAGVAGSPARLLITDGATTDGATTEGTTTDAATRTGVTDVAEVDPTSACSDQAGRGILARSPRRRGHT